MAYTHLYRGEEHVGFVATDCNFSLSGGGPWEGQFAGHGQIVTWHCRGTSKVLFNDQEFDLSAGGLFLVSAKTTPVKVWQVRADMTKFAVGSPEKVLLELGKSNADVRAFLAASVGKAKVANEVSDQGKIQASTSVALQGEWVIVKLMQGQLEEVGGNLRLTFEGDRWSITENFGLSQAGTFKVNTDRTPATIDFNLKGEATAWGILTMAGDRLTVCITQGKSRPADRPTDFATSKDKAHTLWICEKRPAKVPDLEKLQGAWRPVWAEGLGVKKDDELPDKFQGTTLTFRGTQGEMQLAFENVIQSLRFQLDPSTSPKRFDLDGLTKKRLGGIYKFEGDRLWVCLSLIAENGHSKEFRGYPELLFALERVPAAKKAIEDGGQEKAAPPAKLLPEVPDPKAKVPDAAPPKKQHSDQESLHGDWVFSKAEVLKKEDKCYKGLNITIVGDRVMVGTEKNQVFKFKLDPTKTPKAIDLDQGDGLISLGLYVLVGDELKVCFGPAARSGESTEPVARPKDFDSRHGWLWVLRRAKSDPPPKKETSEAERRMKDLTDQSEGLRQMQDVWRRFWMNDQPSHLPPVRIHGGIGP
jgi:uncharacterized protein (TIGR03067 family)